MYSLEVKNSNGDVIIDGINSNFIVEEITATVVETYSSPLWYYHAHYTYSNVSDGAAILVRKLSVGEATFNRFTWGEKDGNDKYYKSVELLQTSSTQLSTLPDAPTELFARVSTDVDMSTETDYGLKLYDANAKTIFNSNYKQIKILYSNRIAYSTTEFTHPAITDAYYIINMDGSILSDNGQFRYLIRPYLSHDTSTTSKLIKAQQTIGAGFNPGVVGYIPNYAHCTIFSLSN